MGAKTDSKTRREALYLHDQELWQQGLYFAGMDEAGRGPLAGPVVAACVVMMPGAPMIPFIDDSKRLSEKRRERCMRTSWSRRCLWAWARWRRRK